LNVTNPAEVVNSVPYNFAKDCVFPIECWSTPKRDEELAAVGLGATSSTGNAHHSAISKLQSGVDFVWVRLAIDGLAAIPGVGGIAALYDEVLHDPVEDGALVRETLLVLPGGDRYKICHSSGNNLIEHFKINDSIVFVVSRNSELNL